MNEFSGERKKEEETVNKLINNEIINKNNFIIKSVSFPAKPEVVKLLQRVRVKAARDNWSFSKLVLVALNEFDEHHPLPNPQAMIDRMLTVQMPHKPITQCCVPECRGKAHFILTLRDSHDKNEQFQVCRVHKRWLHPNFRFLVSYREI